MVCVAQSVVGCVPEHIIARPRASTSGSSSATVAARSAVASATVEHTPVMISIVDSSSSCLAVGCSEPSGDSSARISVAALVSCRVSRETSCSSHSMPRLDLEEDTKGICIR
jgi:hypothetical protein